MIKIVLIVTICASVLAYYSIIKPSVLLAKVAEVKTSNLTGTDFISAEDLNEMLKNKDSHLILVGVSNGDEAIAPMNQAEQVNVASFVVWRPDYTGKGSTEAISKEVGSFRISKAEMENLLSKAGATAESTIVVYSVGSMHDASRFYWQLKLMGHENVKILDGGLKAWVAAGYLTGEAVRLVDENIKSAYKAASYNIGEWGVTIDELITALNNPDQWVIIDTRTKGEFEGHKSSSANIYGTGGLKGGVHIEWINALNSDNTLKTKAELQAIYGEVIKGKKVILLCHSGVRSAHTQSVLREMLGKDDVYNYDGAWIEWSYAASDASADDGSVDADMKAKIKAVTTNWSDNQKKN